MTLLERVSEFTNLLSAFGQCARGKRGSHGYQKLLFNRGEKLLRVRDALLKGRYEWGEYREFWIKDPKARLVSAAPFKDRLVHTAIHNVIEPYFEKMMSKSVYACRKGKGNRRAVIDLLQVLKALGPNRFVIKLDVKSYFASIDHAILFEKLASVLPDQSLNDVLWSLLWSHPTYGKCGVGIPIGNLTSQLFANVYLMSADNAAVNHLADRGFYFRYMDDLVIVTREKVLTMAAAHAVVAHVEGALKLKIPFHKQVPLGDAPVPFLGFVLNHDGYRILRRNERRLVKKQRRLKKQKARPSYLAQVNLSFEAWRDLGILQKEHAA